MYINIHIRTNKYKYKVHPQHIYGLDLRKKPNQHPPMTSPVRKDTQAFQLLT